MRVTERFNQSLGLDSLNIDDMADLMDSIMDRMIIEVLFLRLMAHSMILLWESSSLALYISSSYCHSTPCRGQPKLGAPSDTVIVCRLMELLASDMITHALVLVPCKNHPAALKTMNETKHIVHTVLQQISQSLLPPLSTGAIAQNRKEKLMLASVMVLQAILQDMQILSDALKEKMELFTYGQ